MNKRTKKGFPAGSVCKPCWELGYCPYGPLVEFFPIPTAEYDLSEVQQYYDETLQDLMDGKATTSEQVWCAIERLHYWEPSTWEFLSQFNSKDIECREWGHACPVFCAQSGATETKEARREGRSIPREVMLKVVRRDNHVCQVCHQYVPDEKVEFDHIIPFSKGGATSVSNLRLLCRACNRKKSNGLSELLRNE